MICAMGDKKLFNAATGYVAGNVIANNVSRDLRRISEENQRELRSYIPKELIEEEVAKYMLNGNNDEAFEYLNTTLKSEFVQVALHQKEYIYSLETLIKLRKDKYMPFYKRLGIDMPEQIQTMTADKLCETLGVTNLHIIDSKDGKTSPSHPKADFDFDLLLRAIIIIGLIVFMIVLGTS